MSFAGTGAIIASITPYGVSDGHPKLTLACTPPDALLLDPPLLDRRRLRPLRLLEPPQGQGISETAVCSLSIWSISKICNFKAFVGIGKTSFNWLHLKLKDTLSGFYCVRAFH